MLVDVSFAGRKTGLYLIHTEPIGENECRFLRETAVIEDEEELCAVLAETL